MSKAGIEIEKNGKFAVVIPFYNDFGTIDRTLESVANQKKKPREVLLVNDGSDFAQIQKIAKKYNVILIHSRLNQGSAKTRNLGLQNASAPLIALLDADDIWFPEHLLVHEELWSQADTDVCCISTTLQLSNTYDNRIGNLRKNEKELYQSRIVDWFELAVKNPCWNSATSFKRDKLEFLGGWGSPVPSYAEDYYLLGKVSEAKLRILINKRVTGVYMIRENSKSSKKAQVLESRLLISERIVSTSVSDIHCREIVRLFVSSLIYLSALTEISKAEVNPNSLLSLKVKSTFRFVSKLHNVCVNRITWVFLRPILRFLSKLKLLHFLLRDRATE